MCLVLTLPMNINIKLVPPINNAVDKFAGATNITIMATGIIIGKNPFLKSFITACFLLSCLLKYMNSASFARSDVWNVMLMIGSFIHRLPAFNCTPKNNVYNKSGIDIKKSISATLE